MLSTAESMAIGDDSVVSFQTEMPLPLQQAMTRFIEGASQLGSVPPGAGGPGGIPGAERD